MLESKKSAPSEWNTDIQPILIGLADEKTLEMTLKEARETLKDGEMSPGE